MDNKVGIIVPSYNQGKYLEQALKSIIENKRHARIQLVVMDGGSVDNSLEIIKKYSSEIDYWQSAADCGQAAAINAGAMHLENCKYVMWLNSDDIYENEYVISQIVNFAEKNQSVCCYGKSKFIDEYGSYIGDYPIEKFDLERLSQTCYISQPSVIVRKDVWDEENGLNINLKMCLDFDLWIRIAMKYPLTFYSEYIGNTRIYKDTKTATMQERHLAEAISVVNQWYGNVPIHWIYPQFLCYHKSYLARKIPVILLKPVLYLIRKKYIKKAEQLVFQSIE